MINSTTEVLFYVSEQPFMIILRCSNTYNCVFVWCRAFTEEMKESSFAEEVIFGLRLIYITQGYRWYLKVFDFSDFQGLESPWKQTCLCKSESVPKSRWKCQNLFSWYIVPEPGIFSVISPITVNYTENPVFSDIYLYYILCIW